MGDSETVVAQTSTVVGYTSGGYTSTDHSEASATAMTEVVSSAPIDTAYAVVDGLAQSDGNTYNSDSAALQEASTAFTTYETKESVGVVDATGLATAVEIAPVDSSQATGYDSSVNGNVASGVRAYTASENGNASAVGRDATVPDQQFGGGSAPAMSAEEDRLWSIVRANSLDFNAWTALIDVTEKMDNISSIRKVYDAFLAEFPLCYGYWKKYADHEHRLGSIDKVVEVYERAVQGVTYSVDIWLHYCIFAINTYGDLETARRLFERGLAYVGTDYLSYHLWDKYIEYEYSQQEWSRLAVIYTRILEHPNQHLDRYFNSFKELAGSRPLSELRTVEEAAAVASACSDAEGQEIDGEVRPDAMEQSSKPVNAGSTEVEELEKYISIREEMYKRAKEFDSKIIGFETAIRRPYFHVRPLNVAELENWDNYLDFIEGGDDFNKVVKLYERCLIACANYPELWIRYVLCMKTSGSMDLANNALARATQVFVKRQPEIHLFAARFKEQQGDIEGARAAYQLVHSEISPGLLEAIIKHANMERRLGKLEDAFLLYEQAIAIEKGKEHSQSLPMLFAQYSRFVFLASGNADKAREILVEAAEHVQLSKPLLEALIHLESFLPPPKRIDHIDSLIDKFIGLNPENTNCPSAAEREEISCIFLEFLDLFGDAMSVQKADERHARLFLHHRNTSLLRKRHAEDYLAPDKTKLAKSYPGITPSAQSLMGAYPTSQNQWATGYGVQPQAWPQVTQTQGQPWSSGYPQQAYSAYSSYGSGYTHPQIASSTPQAAVYGAYPPTYPAQQAVPQQSYAPPTAAVAAPDPQSGSVPQAYYGSYY